MSKIDKNESFQDNHGNHGNQYLFSKTCEQKFANCAYNKECEVWKENSNNNMSKCCKNMKPIKEKLCPSSLSVK